MDLLAGRKKDNEALGLQNLRGIRHVSCPRPASATVRIARIKAGSAVELSSDR